VTERVDDSPKTPAVLVADGRRLRCPRSYCLRYDLHGLLGDEASGSSFRRSHED
jgi:hypothetical protein